MEKGFFHPVRGYWQTISVPSADVIAAYPEGTVEVPLIPGPNFEWSGFSWVAIPEPEPEPTVEQ